MKLEAKARLVADEVQRRDKRNAIQKSIDNSQKKIDNIRKTLPSQNNSMKVSPENQATKRQQILQEEIKKQNLRKQKLRNKGTT
jgi:hypothetical protein